jgi:hypothetical protein
MLTSLGVQRKKFTNSGNVEFAPDRSAFATQNTKLNNPQYYTPPPPFLPSTQLPHSQSVVLLTLLGSAHV